MADLDPATLLELERAHPSWTSAKYQAITALGLTRTTFTRQLLHALTTPEALQHDAALTRHLSTRRQQARTQRATRLGQHIDPGTTVLP